MQPTVFAAAASLCLCLASTVLTTADAKPEFVARIPNGANVPGVAALGHVNPEGGGKNNQFGKDFDAAGRKWTAALCAKDSDGDGQTNGQELGDPCCTWSTSSSAKTLWSDGVSHPGDKTKTSNATLWASANCSSTPSSSSDQQASSPSADKSGATHSARSPAAILTAIAGALVVAALC